MSEGKKLRILLACEESQAVTKAFRDLGHEAFSCDLQECSGGYPEWHTQGDVTELLKQHWDIVIAFPPCTYMTNGGAVRMYPQKGIIDQERYKKAMEAKEFFMLFYNLDCKYVAIENPVPMSVIGLPKYEHWMNVVKFFKSKGWTWGGDWKSFKDAPHFEKTFGHTWLTLSKKEIMVNNGLIVNEVVISGTTGITYYEVTDGKTSCGWYDSRLFKRIDDMREEMLKEIGI